MVPYRFEALPLRFFNWGLIKSLKTNWWVVLNEPLYGTHVFRHSLYPSAGERSHQLSPMTDSERRGSEVTVFEICHSFVKFLFANGLFMERQIDNHV